MSECPACGAIQLIALILVFAGSGLAQSVPASISTIQQPVGARPFFDASGDTYYLNAGQPTAGAAQTQYGGGTCPMPGPFPIPGPCPDAGVMKVDPSGKEVWGTLLGGPTSDAATALAIDASGNVAFTGSTGGQFPTTPGAAIGSSTTATVFAARVTADGSKFIYSTYLPDSLTTSSAIAVDTTGNAYIAGKTSAGHAFVLKLSADGSTIDYNVTVGGSGADVATAITVDPAGNAIVVGQTSSPDFPVTAGAFQEGLKGTQNGFLVRLDPSGNVLSSTYFGGSGSDNPAWIAVDVVGNIDLAGFTSSLDLPVTQGTMQPSVVVPLWNNSSPAGFVAQFADDGVSLQWASYMMSTDVLPNGEILDIGVSALAVGANADIYIGGLTGPAFPVTTSAPVICFQGSNNRTNGFLAHLNSKGALLDATYLGNSTGGDIGYVGSVLPLADGTVLIGWRGSPYEVVSKVQFGSEGWTPSACLSNDVLNSATLSGSGGIAAGELVTLTGFGIGPDAGVGYQADAQGNVPTQLAGVQVLFDGVPMPVLYAQSRQINAIAPAGLMENGTTGVTVEYNNQQLGPVIANTVFGNPGIFRLSGESAQAAARNQDGTLNGPTNPAARGSVVSVWGTGYGLTNPGCPVGGLSLPYAAPLDPGISGIMVLITQTPELFGMQPVLGPAETALYAGSAPTLVCGMTQLNFQVPQTATPGALPFLPWIQFEDATEISQHQPQTGGIIYVK